MPLLCPSHTLKVLLIEDHPDGADSLALFLNMALGAKTYIALDGEAGVRAALRHPVDAVVCDINLPKRSGFEVAEAIQEHLFHKPLLIAMSARSDEATVRKAKAVGFDHYLVKPADPIKIEELLRKHCSGIGSFGEEEFSGSHW